MKELTVAIDGPAGSGKSTTARQLARRLGYLYVDTGAMYRAVALKACREGVSPDDAAALAALAERTEIRLAPDSGGVRVFMDGEEVSEAIRTPEVTALSSRVSAAPGVRRRMVQLQREMGRRGGVVMEGRDIGTVVFPDAEVKLFLDASLEERARRRREQLRSQGIEVPLEEVRQAIRERDERDASRAASPLRQAEDAVRINTDDLSPEDVLERVQCLCEAARPRGENSPSKEAP